MADIDDLMHQRARAVLGKTNTPPDEQDDFGLYYPLWYAFDTWVEHDDHGLYPQDGGYDDQNWQLMQDWKTLDRRFGKAMREERAGEDSGGDDIMDTLSRYHRKPETDIGRLIE